jgi:hypothetical protein
LVISKLRRRADKRKRKPGKARRKTKPVFEKEKRSSKKHDAQKKEAEIDIFRRYER